MCWNLFLALVSLKLGFIFSDTKKTSLKILLAFMWLLFVPNTIYIVTDLIHFPYQWSVLIGLDRFVLLLQYLLFIPLGILTYIMSFEVFFKAAVAMLSKYNFHFKMLAPTYSILYLLINCLISLGMFLGRIQRTNSWDLITDPIRVFSDIQVLTSSHHQIILVLLFGFLLTILMKIRTKFFLPV